MTNDPYERILNEVDADEVVELALRMGRIQAPIGRERPLADFLMDSLGARGLSPVRVVASAERHNVVAILRGTGGGRRLVLNAHMDTDRTPEENVWVTRHPQRAISTAWVAAGRIFGRTVLNDRGPMAAFLAAACALQRSGVRLAGDVVLQMVVGETDQAPVDEFQGPEYEGNGTLGTQLLLQRGFLGDYAVVAETTGFAPIWAECGYAFFKLTVYGDPVYTPRIRRGGQAAQCDAVRRLTRLLEQLEGWIEAYERRSRRDFPFGPVEPRASVNALRGGAPYRTAIRAGVCSCYLDVRVPPDVAPEEVRRDLVEFVGGLNLGVEVEMFSARRGYVAQGVEPLLEAVRSAHRRVFGEDPPPGPTEERSMWRDINLFNEWGVPALTYGPPRRSAGTENGDAADPYTTDDSGEVRYFQVEDLVNAARVYALTMLEVCGTV